MTRKIIWNHRNTFDIKKTGKVISTTKHGIALSLIYCGSVEQTWNIGGFNCFQRMQSICWNRSAIRKVESIPAINPCLTSLRCNNSSLTIKRGQRNLILIQSWYIKKSRVAKQYAATVKNLPKAGNHWYRKTKLNKPCSNVFNRPQRHQSSNSSLFRSLST